MISAYLSAVIITACLTFFATLATLFALSAIRKYEQSRRYEQKVELIRRLSVSSKRARRNSKVSKERTTSYRMPSASPKSKVRDLSKRAKFRRSFKLSITIPKEKEPSEATFSPVPLWSPSMLELAVRKTVKQSFTVELHPADKFSDKSRSPKWRGSFFSSSPSFCPVGPDGEIWNGLDESFDNIFGKTDTVAKPDSEIFFYSRREVLGTWLLETCCMFPPFGDRFSTSSFGVRWDRTVLADDFTSVEYDVQCRIHRKSRLLRASGDSSPVSPKNADDSSNDDLDFLENGMHDTRLCELFIDPRGNKKKRVHFLCTGDFASIPSAAFDKNLDNILVQGVNESSPMLDFRVRMKSFAGWGPFSEPSHPLCILPKSRGAPATGAITSRGIELRWYPLKDPRYGRVIRYTLSGKKAGDENNSTILIGKGTSCVVQAIGNKPLRPNTTYLFSLLTKTEAGEVLSNSLPVTTLPTVPEPPDAPLVGVISSSSVELRWQPPCDNGANILKYVLYGRRQRSNRFKRLYTGIETHFIVGGSDGQGQLAPDTVYVFKLKACNIHGDSATSATVNVTTWSLISGPGAGSPSSPTGVSSPTEVSRRHSSADIGRRDSVNLPNSPGGGNSPGRLRPEPLARRNSLMSSPTAAVSTAPARVSELPDGWVECWDPQRENCYYYNSMTGITQWIHPTKGDTKDPELPFRKKRFKLLYSLRERDWPKGGRKIIKITLRRHHLVQDSFQALERLGVEKLKLKTKIVFEGEAGIDSGGLTKDWFLQLSRGLFNPQFCLLKKHETKVYHIDSRSGINEEHLKYFHFLGNFLAKAIYDRQLVDVPFCNMIYKHLLGLPATMDDLADIDPVYHASLKWMLNNSINGVIDEGFCVMADHFGERKTIDLIPGGRDIDVTDENKKEYVQAVLNWHLGGSMKEQLEQLKRGFYEIVPVNEVSEFTASELMLLLNGKQDIDVDQMASLSKYTGGYDKMSPAIQFFWVALKSFSKEERGQLLQFATGTSRAPLDGFDPAFTITKAEGAGEDTLPTSHTCFNQLVLPEYTSIETLMAKLRYAFEIGNAEGFQMS